jgi:hypothetical protein
MPRAKSWSELTFGLLAFAGISAAVIGVLLFARIGALHGEKVRLYLVTREAQEVIDGTEVWLGGRQVGVVSDVRFRPVGTDTTERVLIEMEILSKYLGLIRRDADVRLRPGTNLIGEPVVAITIGTTKAPPVHDGDTLRGAEQEERRHRAADLAALEDSVIAVAGTVQRLTGEIRSTGSNIVQLRRRSEEQARAVGRAMDQFTDRATRSHGTVALTMHDTAFHAEVVRLTAQSDSIRRLLASGRGTLGRFRRDSTVLTKLLTDARRVLASVDTLRTRMAPSQILTRRDSAMSRQLNGVHVQLDSLIGDVKQHPLKYLSL